MERPGEELRGPAGPAAPPGARVLLVDDDPGFLQVARLQLELEGHAVLTSGDGLAALDLARRELPDVVFLDLALPGLDGFELLTRLKAEESTRSIPVYVVSGRCERDVIERSRRLGAIDYLYKSGSVTSALCRAAAGHAGKRQGGARDAA